MTGYEGRTFGNYRLTRHLGDGYHTTVYIGEHTHHKTLAAIKIDTGYVSEQFRTDVQTLMRLRHPHIIRFLDFGVSGNSLFLF